MRGIHVRIAERIDSLPVLKQEIGYFLGHKPDESGLMQGASTAGTPRTIRPVAAEDLGTDPFILFSTGEDVGGLSNSLAGRITSARK